MQAAGQASVPYLHLRIHGERETVLGHKPRNAMYLALTCTFLVDLLVEGLPTRNTVGERMLAEPPGEGAALLNGAAPSLQPRVTSPEQAAGPPDIVDDRQPLLSSDQGLPRSEHVSVGINEAPQALPVPSQAQATEEEGPRICRWADPCF